jgi:hypothetical protein
MTSKFPSRKKKKKEKKAILSVNLQKLGVIPKCWARRRDEVSKTITGRKG